MSQNDKLLSVRNLSTHFFTEAGTVKAVQDVNLAIKKSETFALVGESGCGKSITALSIMRLVPPPQGKIVSGQIFLEQQNLLALSEGQMRQIRGGRISMIFQEPQTSLNPVFTVGSQIAETIKLHQKKNNRQAWDDAVEMLQKVGISEPQRRVRDYPFQMSGGMQQRVMIAMAVSCQPALLIADEPTTALDVTIQAQILDLLDALQQQNGMSILLITHDLGIVYERAKDVAVMYASQLVEVSDSQSLFAEPLHPYTQGLLKSLPHLNCPDKRLWTISGNVPNPLNFPTGCKFHPRCLIGKDDKKCNTDEPLLKEVQPGHCVACWYAKGYKEKI